ncbi:MAG: excinuclease ABC subunit UvrA, partial [Bacteroidales bacterium]|nr:excinuclease ABC subunit UvrA [Bacteroidales bacterium]
MDKEKLDIILDTVAETSEWALAESENIEVYGARVHNLKNIDVLIPRNKLVVITGISGSGKSSLAFDTIYAEGQRRYLETFSAYARQFIGTLERPDVDKINGLSPVISIEQKTTIRNPRSTVGTITEIYDFLRLLYARASDAYSYLSGEKMVRYSQTQIIQLILDKYNNKHIMLLSPIVRGRKGHYRDLFHDLQRQGFLKVRIDGELRDIVYNMKLDRYKTHDIEVMIDMFRVNADVVSRLNSSINTAMHHSNGLVAILDNDNSQIQFYSRNLICPVTGISYSEPEPNNFSFNSAYGACPKCSGLGSIQSIDIDKVIPDRKISIHKGAIKPLGEYKPTWIFRQIEALADKYGFSLNDPVSTIPDNALNAILYGTDEVLKVKNDIQGNSLSYSMSFEGIISFLSKQMEERNSDSLSKWFEGFLNYTQCPECQGQRLKKESLHFKILDQNISQVSGLDLIKLRQWIDSLSLLLDNKRKIIAGEIIREIKMRIDFMIEVGLDYLTIDRATRTLSGGESQRIRLATQIGSQLTGVLYLLDEPTIGLHQRDNLKVIHALRKLRDIGNSVIVVEHDREMIEAADYIIDIGPGAGSHGGKITAAGTLKEIIKADNLTADYLNHKKTVVIPEKSRKGTGKFLTLTGATGNNLKNVTVSLPLGKMICITGVSGSGKSTLINETLYPILSRHFYRSHQKPLPYTSIQGIENIDKVIEIDQSPIGRTPRSN